MIFFKESALCFLSAVILLETYILCIASDSEQLKNVTHSLTTYYDLITHIFPKDIIQYKIQCWMSTNFKMFLCVQQMTSCVIMLVGLLTWWW